jgi:hypothetical protein
MSKVARFPRRYFTEEQWAAHEREIARRMRIWRAKRWASENWWWVSILGLVLWVTGLWRAALAVLPAGIAAGILVKTRRK